jgi:hypothetical protein
MGLRLLGGIRAVIRYRAGVGRMDTRHSDWTIHDGAIVHTPCNWRVGVGMVIRHMDWSDGYCTACGEDIPDEWVRKLHYILKMEAI